MEVAYRHVLNKLEHLGNKVSGVIPINMGRYIIVQSQPENFMVMFKRDTFHNFGRMFSNKGLSGVGDTINVDDLKTAVQKEVKMIYTIFPNGHVYSIPLMDFLTNSERWTNKEGKEVRSISIHLYKKEFEV